MTQALFDSWKIALETDDRLDYKLVFGSGAHISRADTTKLAEIEPKNGIKSFTFIIISLSVPLTYRYF